AGHAVRRRVPGDVARRGGVPVPPGRARRDAARGEAHPPHAHPRRPGARGRRDPQPPVRPGLRPSVTNGWVVRALSEPQLREPDLPRTAKVRDKALRTGWTTGACSAAAAKAAAVLLAGGEPPTEVAIPLPVP